MIQSRQKALGQFLTGRSLARLLAAVAATHEVPQRVVDPMCGTGDMLLATRELVGASAQLVGVDIDAAAIASANATFDGNARAILRAANAFKPQTWETLDWPLFDLVITNPPYVRYQAMASADAHGLPSGDEVRADLRRTARDTPRLDDDDRTLLLRSIDAYSGLSDLAVPSWMLCAMLVAPGGTLAMVVPETWLSRIYAEHVKWLLLKLFRVRTVIENANHSWFPRALVKTHLLIADRVPQVRDPTEHWRGTRYPFVSLATGATAGSLVADLYPDSADPDRSFARDVEAVVSGDLRPLTVPFPFQLHDLGQEADSVPVEVRASGIPLATSKPTAATPHGGGVLVPHALREIVSRLGTRLVPLADMGVAVGQGLRTGANVFFYADVDDIQGGQVRLRAHRLFGARRFHVPACVARPVLRTQSELRGSGLTVACGGLPGRALVLGGWALPEDLERSSAGLLPGTDTAACLRPMPEELAAHVRIAAALNLGKDEMKLIPEMSAVRTNVNLRAGHFWYHLPPLVERHKPDLFVARVNHLTPMVWLNPGRGVIIDANFATIWRTSASHLDVYALLALLNSQWARTAMELTGTVMGGGALKFEANHLRRLPLPLIDRETCSRLSQLGRALANGVHGVQDLIDSNVSTMIAGPQSAPDLTGQLARIVDEAVSKRSRAARGQVHARLV